MMPVQMAMPTGSSMTLSSNPKAYTKNAAPMSVHTLSARAPQIFTFSLEDDASTERSSGAVASPSTGSGIYSAFSWP